MKKKIAAALVILAVFAAAIAAFSAWRSSEAYRKARAAIRWDCSVVCAGDSTADAYTITYSDIKVSPKTGALTLQNPNDFAIAVHLLCEGEPELVSGSIPAKGCYSFMNIAEKEYTVGVHADAAADTIVKVYVYDGQDTQPYTN